MSFWACAYGFAVGFAGTRSGGVGDPTTIALGAIAIGLSAIPLAFIIAAVVSRKPDWPLSALAAMGLAVAVGLPLMWFRNPLASIIAGFTAGAVVALSRPLGMTWHHRAIAGAIVVILVFLGLGFQPLFVPTAFLAPALPFTAMGVADMLAPRAPWAQAG